MCAFRATGMMSCPCRRCLLSPCISPSLSYVARLRRRRTAGPTRNVYGHDSEKCARPGHQSPAPCATHPCNLCGGVFRGRALALVAAMAALSAGDISASGSQEERIAMRPALRGHMGCLRWTAAAVVLEAGGGQGIKASHVLQFAQSLVCTKDSPRSSPP